MAAYKAKTIPTKKSVDAFLDKVEPEGKRDDCKALVKLMSEVSKEPAKMWGPGIVGFGQYHYEYESGHSGDACLVAFAPRKQNMVLYLPGIVAEYKDELKKLGKVKTSVGCIYFKKLDDLDIGVLKSITKKALTWVKKGEKPKGKNQKL